MHDVATGLGGENAPVLLEVFEFLRTTDPETRVIDLLKSDKVGQLMKRGMTALNTQTEHDSGVLCRCPECGFAFETDLS